VGLVAGYASHRGLVRQTNEDSFLVRKGLYAVCDGMGGARGGEVASQMACKRLVALAPASAGMQELRQAIADANESIAARSIAEPHLLGMGTTLTSALIQDTTMILGHVGDSRAYLLREGSLRQLTDDHSWVGEMVRRGELTAAEAAVHPHRSVITKALGTEGEADPDLVEVPLEPGDRLLLCSDGLSGMVPDETIEELLKRPDGPQATAEALIDSALKGGGEDNVTVVVVDVLGPAQPGADVAGGPQREAQQPDVPHEEDVTGVDQTDGDATDDTVTLGPSDRGDERSSSIPGFMRPALGMARLGRRPPIWARQTPAGASPDSAVRTDRWSRRKWIFTVVCIVIVLALAISAFAVFNANVYYVGAADGMVALYQGLPANFLGIDLSSVVELGTVSYDSLPEYQRERVDAHDLVGKEEGQAFLRGLAALHQ
jgi:protein phosphatase